MACTLNVTELPAATVWLAGDVVIASTGLSCQPSVMLPREFSELLPTAM